jgi:hypothetical protein
MSSGNTAGVLPSKLMLIFLGKLVTDRVEVSATTASISNAPKPTDSAAPKYKVGYALMYIRSGEGLRVNSAMLRVQG